MRNRDTSEVHLFIIWENARRSHEKEIIDDISSKFEIIKIYEVHWSKKNFALNLTRFYGTSLPSGSGKEKHCGTGPFLLVIVRDLESVYAVHETSKGPQRVNSKVFTTKSLHREWTGGGHKIHATNNPREVNHDLVLLLGLNTIDFLRTIKSSTRTEQYKKDLTGSGGWKDIKELFYVLNNTNKYIVMRNFDPLPNEYYADIHGDIDLLVDNYDSVAYVTGAEPVFADPGRVHNKIKIGKEDVLFDLRYVGDNYYDYSWQKDILRQRRQKDILQVPNDENHFFSLLYHALIHKPHVAEDYIVKLQELNKFTAHRIDDTFFDTGKAHRLLGSFLATKSYAITRADDQSVFFHDENYNKVRRGMWRARPFKYAVKKVKNIRKG